MSQLTGILTAAATLGLESIEITPTRFIGPFVAQVTLEENHVDDLEITDSPVETGARISDHAYLRPAEVTIHCSWSTSPSASGAASGITGAISGTIGAARGLLNGLESLPGLGGLAAGLGGLGNSLLGGASSLLSGAEVGQPKDVYESLLALQALRVPFEVATGKRIYANMLVKSLRVVTSKETENTLDLTAVFRQILIVQTQVVSVAAPVEAQAAPEVTAPVAEKGDKAPDDSWATADAEELQASVNPAPPKAPDDKPALPEGYKLDPKTGNVYNRQGIVDTSATIRYDNNQPITPPPS